ncbi:DUF3164 family protein [Avibacterium paragallinarum]|uniref:DUF3164 family protein n=1 Tax=Avibacterium paragallinarum TaxID=728 RepID=UPI0035ABA80A
MFRLSSNCPPKVQRQTGGNKGNITLFSYDGKYKIVRAISDHLQFDERIQALRR